MAALVLGPEQRAVFDRMQAFMAVLEGYAEHVMDAVGAEALARPRRRCAQPLDRRRGERSGFMRVLERLIGMDLKLRQYKLGKPFCDGVVARGGIDGAQPRLGSPRGDADARPSSRTRPAGFAAPSRPSSTAPPSARGAPEVGIRTSVRTAIRHSWLIQAVRREISDPTRNSGAVGVYKHVFAGYSPCRTDLELISLVRDTKEEGGHMATETTTSTTGTTTTDTSQGDHRS